MHGLGGLDNLEIGVPCLAGLGWQGLVRSHEVCGVVMHVAALSQFWSPPRFRIGGWALGWGTGGDEVCDPSNAVVEPEIKSVWSREARGGDESHFGEKRRDVIPIRILAVEAPR